MTVKPNRKSENTHSAISISEFKAHLAEYLRKAKAGIRVVIKDRELPIAQLTRLEHPEIHEDLIIPAQKELADLAKMKFGVQVEGTNFDVFALLREERDRR